MFIYGMVKIIPVQMQAAAAFRHVLSHGAALELHGRCPDYQILPAAPKSQADCC
jgi:hypothetical protein